MPFKAAGGWIGDKYSKDFNCPHCGQPIELTVNTVRRPDGRKARSYPFEMLSMLEVGQTVEQNHKDHVLWNSAIKRLKVFGKEFTRQPLDAAHPFGMQLFTRTK